MSAISKEVRKRLDKWGFASPKPNFLKRAKRKVRWEEKQLKKEKEPYGVECGYVEPLRVSEYFTFVKWVFDNHRKQFWSWIGAWAILLTFLSLIASTIWFFGYSDSEPSVVTHEQIVKQEQTVKQEPAKQINTETIAPPKVEEDVIVAPPLPKPKKVIMPKDDYDQLVEAVSLIPDLKDALEETTDALNKTKVQLQDTQLQLRESNVRYTELRMEHERVLLSSKRLMMDYATLQSEHTEVKAALRASEKRFDDLIDAVFD